MNTNEDVSMGDSTTLTVRLSKEAKAKLDAMAESTRRSKNFLAAEAISEYVAANSWQVEAIGQAVAEADQGGGASYAHEEVMGYLERRAQGERHLERPEPIKTP